MLGVTCFYNEEFIKQSILADKIFQLRRVEIPAKDHKCKSLSLCLEICFLIHGSCNLKVIMSIKAAINSSSTMFG